MAALAFQNGHIVPASDLVLSPIDAGFVYGATITDFCRTYLGRLFRWPDHLARFRQNCEACHIPLLISDSDLTAAAERLVAHNLPLSPSGELVLTAYATPGPLGHLTESGQSGPPTLAMHTRPLNPARYARFYRDGVKLTVVGQMSSCDLVPSQVKHRSRLPWWMAEQQPHEPGSVPVLLNSSGQADSAIGAVLIVQDGVVLRPPEGTVLESVSVKVISELCETLGVPFREAAFDVRDSTAGVEVLLAGSGFGVAPVSAVGSSRGVRIVPGPGAVYRQLVAAWSQLIGCDLLAPFLAVRS